MQKVVGSSPIIRSSRSPRKSGAFVVSERADTAAVGHASATTLSHSGHAFDETRVGRAIAMADAVRRSLAEVARPEPSPASARALRAPMASGDDMLTSRPRPAGPGQCVGAAPAGGTPLRAVSEGSLAAAASCEAAASVLGARRARLLFSWGKSSLDCVLAHRPQRASRRRWRTRPHPGASDSHGRPAGGRHGAAQMHGKREWRPVKPAAQGRSRAPARCCLSSGVHAVSSRRRADLAADSNRRACHFVALPPRAVQCHNTAHSGSLTSRSWRA